MQNGTNAVRDRAFTFFVPSQVIIIAQRMGLICTLEFR